MNKISWDTRVFGEKETCNYLHVSALNLEKWARASRTAPLWAQLWLCCLAETWGQSLYSSGIKPPGSELLCKAGITGRVRVALLGKAPLSGKALPCWGWEQSCIIDLPRSRGPLGSGLETFLFPLCQDPRWRQDTVVRGGAELLQGLIQGWLGRGCTTLFKAPADIFLCARQESS